MHYYSFNIGDYTSHTARLTSIKTFLKKLPLHQVIDAADKSWIKSGPTIRFKYFCGICWNMIKQGGQKNG